MRVLIVHSRYLSGPASGENAVVADEAKLLTQGGHHVRVWQPDPSAATRLDLVRTGMEAIWSRDAVSRVRAMVRELRAEIVHFHNLFPKVSPAAFRASAEEGARPVVTLHNYRLMCLAATLLRDGRVCEDCVGRTPWPGVVHRCYRNSTLGSGTIAASLSFHRALRSFDRIALYLPVGEFVRRKYVEAGFPADRLRVKSNFSWPTTKRGKVGNYFLYLGRLADEKGVRTIIEAWNDVPAKLLIVGNGPQSDSLRASAPRNVAFIGTVPQEEVPNILRGARAVLLPSLWYEAQPRVILEAYAAGVPVIASRIGGLPDFVRGDETGLLVDPGDRLAWAEAGERLLDDDEAERLGTGAYAEWQSRYSPEQGLRALEEAYRDVLSR